MPSDLAILSVAANQLFQSTEHMGTEAVVCILTGLRSVSNRALPTAFQLPSQSRCAARPRKLPLHPSSSDAATTSNCSTGMDT